MMSKPSDDRSLTAKNIEYLREKSGVFPGRLMAQLSFYPYPYFDLEKGLRNPPEDVIKVLGLFYGIEPEKIVSEDLRDSEWCPSKEKAAWLYDLEDRN